MSALTDRRVLCTAPPVYAPRLSAALLRCGARPIIAPTVETAHLDAAQSEALEDAVLRLCDFNVVALLSRSAIGVFAHVLRAVVNHDESAAQLALRASAIRIAAMGADAAFVRDSLGVVVDFLPLDPTPQGLADLLAADPDFCNGGSVLVPVPLVKGMREPPVVPAFLRRLSEIGFSTVCAVPAYLMLPVAHARLDIELDLLLHPAVPIDAVVVSSCAEAYALYALLTNNGGLDRFLKLVSERRVLVAAHGPVTAQGIADVFEVDPIVSQDSSSFDGVAAALDDAFAKRLQEQGKVIMPL